MDAAASKTADFERRASWRVSRRISVHGGEVGDDLDDVELQAAGISDGFRPTSVSDITASDDDEEAAGAAPAAATPSSSAPHETKATAPRTATTDRPSSIAKPPAPIDSFALENDGAVGPINQAFLSRQSSAAASTHTPADNSVVADGPSGSRADPERGARPVPRTFAASSSPPHDPAYAGPRGPAFPYGLYPQNTIGIPAPAMTAIPVGFPGMADNYRRQVGPDGEEVPDMVGPDGHTEQLPPYTRYPEEAYARKTMPGEQPVEPVSGAAAAPSASAAVTVVAADSTAAAPAAPAALPPAAAAAAAAPAAASAIPNIPGAGGIGLAPRNPEFDGSEPGSPQSRHTSRSFTTGSEVSHHEINTAARTVTEEKPKRTARWQTYGRRRLWGIVPYWAICLLVTGLLLMGIILGAVVGSFVAKSHRRPPRPTTDPQSESSGTATVTVDATPIPTPSDLPPLPTGTFGLPLIPNKSPSSCFNDTTQAQAWSCQIWFGSGMTITIGSIPPKEPDGPIYDVAINCNQSLTIGNNVFFYGEQPPVITPPQPLQLVNDTLDPNRGPAWFKMLPYNKTVIVPESRLSMPDGAPSVSGQKIRRAFGGPGEFHRKGTAQAGDKPWVCTWPDTLLEVFIYPIQNTSMYKMSLTSTYTPAAAAPTKVTDPASAANGAAAPTAPTPGPPGPGPSEFAPPPPPYPRVVKLEERRMPRSRPATCVKYHIKPQDGNPKLVAEPIFDQNGKQIVVPISEAEPPPGMGPQQPPPPGMGQPAPGQPPPPGGPDRRSLAYDSGLLPRDTADLSDCGCLWMVT